MEELFAFPFSVTCTSPFMNSPTILQNSTIHGKKFFFQKLVFWISFFQPDQGNFCVFMILFCELTCPCMCGYHWLTKIIYQGSKSLSKKGVSAYRESNQRSGGLRRLDPPPSPREMSLFGNRFTSVMRHMHIFPSLPLPPNLLSPPPLHFHCINYIRSTDI